MWIKKHWNDPITVGGYTKMCIWCYVLSCITVVAYWGYLLIRWTTYGDKLRDYCSEIVHKIKTIKRKTNSQNEVEA